MNSIPGFPLVCTSWLVWEVGAELHWGYLDWMSGQVHLELCRVLVGRGLLPPTCSLQLSGTHALRRKITTS